jgi:uncharacterized damage-inducible protein DinB
MVALTGEELRAWVESTTDGWKGFFSTHPEALSFSCDVRETKTMAELLRHIVAVELLFAEHLHGLPETARDAVAANSVAAMYATHEKAMALLRELDAKDDAYWESWMDFPSRRAGVIRAPRRTFLVHSLMHSVRHYAQMATLVRRQGIASELHLDYLLMRPKDPVV